MNVKGKGLHTAERRKALLERLCLRRHDTCESLAAEFHVSSDTIHRDLAALMDEYPIETVRGRGGGVKVEDGFYLYRTARSLTRKEYDALKKMSAQMEGEDRDTLAGILSKFAP